LALCVGCGNGDDSSITGGTTSAAGTGGGTSTGGAAGGGQGGSGGGSTGGSVGGGGATGGSTTSGGGNGGTGGASIQDAGGDRSDANDAPSGQDAADAKRDAMSDGSLTDGATPYNPCPAAGTPCAIMPVGDSITQGQPDPAAGGYRVPLFHLAHMANKNITFVGSQSDGPTMVDGVTFPRSHEGHSGYNIDTTQGRQGISQFFPGAISQYKPNIVLLMIGTNDVDTGEDNIPTRLGTLMDTMLNADPKLLLVVAQIVPQQIPEAGPDTKNMQVQAYNAAIPALVKARTDAGKHVLVVDMYNAFASNPNYSNLYLVDRLHPNPAGYTVMATTWYAAIGSLLR
jgi:lysophospholipase L1-like esterase